MKRMKYFVFIFSVFLCACSSPNESFIPWDNNLSTEQNIAKNAIPLENNDDFTFLDNIVRDRSIIILGEEGHADNTTIITKIKIINYLKNKGFNSIAFEGNSLLPTYVKQNSDYSKFAENWKVIPFSSSTEKQLHDNKLYQSFIEAIKERKIKIWGMDYEGGYSDIDIVKTMLDKYSNQELLSIDWEKLRELYVSKFVPWRQTSKKSGKISATEQYELMRMIDAISNYTQFLMYSEGKTEELKVIMQWIRNLNTLFSAIEVLLDTRKALESKISQIALDLRNRDIQMAENIDWIVKNFPEEKLIVWTANFHGAKDISQTRYPTDSLFYLNFQSMGEFLATTHGNKMYSLAFSSLNHSENSESGGLEIEIANVTGDAPNAFINFEPLRFADGYRDKEFESNVIMKKQGKWLYIFDGLYYIRDQIRE